MKNYVITTNSGEIIGTGTTVTNAVKSALNNISIDEFIDYCTSCIETTENVESFSMYELYDIAKTMC